MKQYELWWARLPLPAAVRPVLLLTRNEALHHLSAITVVQITRTRRGIPQEVPLGSAEGLPAASVANFDNVLTIPRWRLLTPIGTISGPKVLAVKIALGRAFAWTELTQLAV